MQPNSRRRVHGAEFKAQVLSECQVPGASIAAVALAHGLNVNLVRKWLVGRGLKRSGLEPATESSPSAVSAVAPSAAPLRFIPLELASPDHVDGDDDRAAVRELRPPAELTPIHVELRRGATLLTVRWPTSHADACAAWLREVAGTAPK